VILCTRDFVSTGRSHQYASIIIGDVPLLGAIHNVVLAIGSLARRGRDVGYITTGVRLGDGNTAPLLLP
jgi:hypothetical protein